MALSKIDTPAIADAAVTDAKSAVDLSALATNAALSSTQSDLATANATIASLRSDIGSLALQSARADNQAAFNLGNSFVDQFEDATGIDTTTTSSLDVGEYVSTVTGSLIDFESQQIPLRSGRTDLNLTTQGYVSSWTNDSVQMEHSGSNYYSMGMVDYLFDISKEFEIWVFGAVDSTGIVHDRPFMAHQLVITTDTSVAEGVSPNIWASPASGSQYGYLSHSDVGTYVLNNSYQTAISFGSVLPYNESGATSRTVDLSNGSGLIGQYYNTGGGSYGYKVTNNPTTNTLTMQFLIGGPNSPSTSTAQVTVNNTPSTGRLAYWFGEAGGTDTTRYFSLSGREDLTPNRSFVNSLVANVTGNFTGVTQTAASSVSEMSIVVLYEDNAGTATLNTDITAEVSANNGADWSTVTLAPAGNFSSNLKLAKSAPVSVTAGTQPKYRINFANQANGSKVTRIQGVALVY